MLLRPIKSRILFEQMLGRGTRPRPRLPHRLANGSSGSTRRCRRRRRTAFAAFGTGSAPRQPMFETEHFARS